MVIEMLLGVVVFAVIPVLLVGGVGYYIAGRRHHMGMWFEMWYDWRWFRRRHL